MGLIFPNISAYLPPIFFKALNPKSLDPAALHDWVRLHMRIMQSKKKIHHTNLHLNFCSSQKPPSPLAIIMRKAKKLRTLAGKTLNESLERSTRHIQGSVLLLDFFLALPQESKNSQGRFLSNNERRYNQIMLQIAAWYCGFITL